MLRFELEFVEREHKVRVLDFSGSLVDVRSATRDEQMQAPFIDASIWVTTLEGDPNSLYARWDSGICDDLQIMRISADIRSIEVEQPPRQPCDAVGSATTVVLSFDRPVQGGTVGVRLMRAPLPPA